jgi:beta-lactamase regulating signal transducer with metallopeptidase domain
VLVCWLFGAAAFARVQLGRQRTLTLSLGTLRPIGKREWISSNPVFSPIVIGAIHPRIVLPADFLERYTPIERDLVLAHERMHIQRLDPLANLACVLVRIVFWFHPLVHLAVRCLQTDQELACDASVIASRPACRAVYAQALLKTQLADTGLPTSCQWDSETARALNRRLVMLKASIPTDTRRFAGTTLITLAALTFAGFAWAAQPQTTPTQTVSTLAGVDLAGATTLKDIIDRCQRAKNPPHVTVDGRAVDASGVAFKDVSLAGIERIEVLRDDTEGPRGTINIVLRR